MDTGLSIGISGIKDCPNFAIFDIDGGCSVGSCFDKVGTIAKAVENVVKRGDEINLDNVLGEIQELTNDKYSAFDDDDDFYYSVSEEEEVAINDNSYYYAWIEIDNDKNIKVGQLLVVDGAIRDEGFSYHYIEPSRYIYTDKKISDKIAAYLEQYKIPYLRGLTWTTDALFRETADKVELRKSEGAKIVEMEQAGCIAVSQFRGFDYGAIIYGGDDVASEEWNHRGWNTREGIRYNLVMLCKELVKEF